MDKKGIFTWFGFLLPIDERLRLIKEAGFQSVCVWWGDEFNETDGRKEEMCERSSKYGLEVENVHLPYYGCDKLWFDSAEGEYLVRHYVNEIKNASKFNFKTFVMHPFEKMKPLDGNEELFLSRMKYIAEEASEDNCNIAIENLADNDAFIAIMQHIDNENVGICFDSGHNNVASHNNFRLLSLFGNRLMAVHLHDNNSEIDQHLLPGEGNIDWVALSAVLHSAAYNGSCMLESCMPYGYDEKEGYGAPVTENLSAWEYLKKASASCSKILKI